MAAEKIRAIYNFQLSSFRQGVADTYTAPGAWRSLVSPQAVQTSP